MLGFLKLFFMKAHELMPGKAISFFVVLVVLIYLSSSVAAAKGYRQCEYTDINHERVIEKNCIMFGPDKQNAVISREAIISKEVIAKAFYDSDGLSSLQTGGKFYYFNKSGKTVRVITYDNGPDYFVEGLARTIKNGRIGFFDKSLNIVIKPQYDFAFPIKNGISIVCNGCRVVREGEYSQVQGGKWGAINKKGEVVHNINTSRKELESRLEKR